MDLEFQQPQLLLPLQVQFQMLCLEQQLLQW
jgi:hypothetical protein